MKNELQNQKRILKGYMIMWFFSVVAAALVVGGFDTELIKSMGPEGHAIVAGISFSMMMCFVLMFMIQVGRTAEKIWILKQWIGEDEEDNSEN